MKYAVSLVGRSFSGLGGSVQMVDGCPIVN